MPIAARSGARGRPALHEAQVVPDAPSQALPKDPAAPIACEQEQVALGNALLAELFKAGGNQGPSDAHAPPFTGDGKVVQVAAPAVVPAKHRRDHFAPGNGDLAEARVPPQISAHGLAAVRLV